ncbi:unnamed protein product [Trichobilharzia szidati]|nr:unnamed protein product [Trichobilharzia szidati]
MEALIAKLAVYDWTDVRGFFSSFLLNLNVLLKNTNGVVFVLTLVLSIFLTIYIWKIRPKELSKRYKNVRETDSCNDHEFADIENLHRLYKLNNLTASMLCNVWLFKVNDCINNSLERESVHFNPFSECTLSDVKTSSFEVHREESSENLTLYFSVSIPMLYMHGDLVYKQSEQSQKITVSLKNYFMKMCCKVQAVNMVISKLIMYSTSPPQFDVLMDAKMFIPSSEFKKLLVKIISELTVSWGPDDMVKQYPSSRDTLLCKENQIGETSSHPKAQEHKVFMDSAHKWTDSTVKTLSCELNNLDFVSQNEFKSVNRCDSERHTGVKSTIPKDEIALLVAQKDKPSSPIVLSHNARLRQSLVARQLPRPFMGKMIRSASCYGEEGTTGLLQERETEYVDLNSQNMEQSKAEPTVQLQIDTEFSSPSKVELIDSRITKKEIENSSGQTTERCDSSQDFYHRNSMRKPNTKVDVSPLRERIAHNLASKKLLVKVVKAEELSVKSISGAYCVVELDEPYQRHSTHCSMSGQLFWDQHLLFDLNNNSKRIALEVFELGKRKKSYSRGRAELLLVHLLTNPNSDGDNETNLCNISDTIRRRIPLIDRSGVSAESASTSNANSPAVQSPGIGNSLSATTNQNMSANTNSSGQPFANGISSITAEFNFMEKATEDFRPRPSSSSSQMQRVPTSKVSQSTGTQNISQEHHSTDHSGAFSHSPSLEFSNNKSTSSAHNRITIEHTMHSVTEHIQTDSGEEVDNFTTSKDKDFIRRSLKDGNNELKFTASLKPGNTSSPISSQRHSELVPIRGADEEHATIPYSPLIYDTTKLSETSSDGHDSLCEVNEQFKESVSSNEQHTHQGQTESDTNTKSPNTSDEVNVFFGSKADSKQSDALCKRSALLGVTSTNSNNNSDLISDSHRTDSPVSSGSPAVTSRAHSLASRLKSTRILSSGVLRHGKRGATDEPMGSCSNVSSLALLGPSRQLAGVVAGLSSLASDSTTAPTAAALASAMAVIGATGSWKPQTAVDSDSAHLSGSTVSDLLSRRDSKLEASDDSPSVPPHTTSFGPPVHFVPPPTYIAADSPGTFTALSQPRRSDASNLGLFRIFRHKKKRFRSVGAEKLLYWEANNFDDLDAISTEGYHRILQDDCEINSTNHHSEK